MNSRGFEFSFAWLFAMIVGGAILILAIFLATRIADTSQLESSTTSAAQLGVLLNPVETSFEDGKTYQIHFPDETRIANTCTLDGTFGKQEIRVSTKTIAGTWGKPGVPSIFYNKYIFSSSQLEGKDITILTKPLEMPFKVGDIIVMSTDSYCLVNPPTDVQDEINSLGTTLFNTTSVLRNCPRGSVTVCFSQTTGCTIIVNLLSKTVRKNQKIISYTGPLLYGAIVADPATYECEVKRLEKRATELSYIYIDKATLLAQYGCGTTLENDLRAYIRLLSSNVSLGDIQFSADTLNQKNEALTCKLF